MVLLYCDSINILGAQFGDNFFRRKMYIEYYIQTKAFICKIPKLYFQINTKTPERIS